MTLQGGILSRRLFDHELDNQHEEPLLVAQLAAYHLKQRSLAVPDVSLPCRHHNEPEAASASLPLAWLLLIAERLKLVSTVLDGAQGGGSGVHWAGGLANHASTFTFLFRCLLTFWVYGPHSGAEFAGDGQMESIRSCMHFSLRAISASGGLAQNSMAALIVAVAKQWGLLDALSQPQERGDGESVLGESLFLIDAGPCRSYCMP